MRFACWVTKATNTHSEYVILIFPTATMVMWTPLIVTLNIYCLSRIHCILLHLNLRLQVVHYAETERTLWSSLWCSNLVCQNCYLFISLVTSRGCNFLCNFFPGLLLRLFTHLKKRLLRSPFVVCVFTPHYPLHFIHFSYHLSEFHETWQQPYGIDGHNNAVRYSSLQ